MDTEKILTTEQLDELHALAVKLNEIGERAGEIADDAALRLPEAFEHRGDARERLAWLKRRGGLSSAHLDVWRLLRLHDLITDGGGIAEILERASDEEA
jgi:hypothetical protein